MAQTQTTHQSYVTEQVNQVMMRGLLSAARRVLPYFNGTLPGTMEMMQGTRTIAWRRIDNLAAATAALTETTVQAWQNGRAPATPTVTDISVALTKHGNWIAVSEEVDLFNLNSRTADLLDTLGENAGHSLNILQRDVFDGATNVRYGNGVANESAIVTDITLNDIKYVVNQLNRQSAMKFTPLGVGTTEYGTSPIRSAYYGACHVDIEETVRLISGFTPVEKYAGYTPTLVNEFGTVGGVRWVSTEIAPVDTSAGTTSVNGFRGASATQNDVYSTFIYGREAVGSVGLGDEYAPETIMGFDIQSPIEIISHAPGSAGAGDPFNEMGSLAWKAHWAGKVLNKNWVWNLRTLNVDL